MAIRTEFLDEILKDYKNPEDLLGKDGILNELKKAIMERALDEAQNNGSPKLHPFQFSRRRPFPNFP